MLKYNNSDYNDFISLFVLYYFVTYHSIVKSIYYVSIGSHLKSGIYKYIYYEINKTYTLNYNDFYISTNLTSNDNKIENPEYYRTYQCNISD
jgi:hypothetical protein